MLYPLSYGGKYWFFNCHIDFVVFSIYHDYTRRFSYDVQRAD